MTVQPKRVRVTGIRFDEPTHTLMMGSTVTLQPIIAPDDATVKNLTWVSSDASEFSFSNLLANYKPIPRKYNARNDIPA